MSKFKIGDKVKCVNNFHTKLVKNKIYTVDRIDYDAFLNEYFIDLKEFTSCGDFHSNRFELVEDVMQINMQDKYAYSHDPYTQARILCVDGNHTAFPVISISKDGITYYHNKNGIASYNVSRDLVPLKTKIKPIEAWAVVYNNGSHSIFSYKDSAQKFMESFKGSRFKPVKIVKLQEVQEG